MQPLDTKHQAETELCLRLIARLDLIDEADNTGNMTLDWCAIAFA